MIIYDDDAVGGHSVFVHPNLIANVAFVCLPEGHARGEDRKPIGTCFFVHIRNSAGNRGYGYAVTAKHVIEMNDLSGEDGPRALIRFNEDKGVGVVYAPVVEPWRYHPDPSVDLAIASFGHGPEHRHRTRGYSVSLQSVAATIATIAETKSAGVSMWPPQPGEDLRFIGLLPDAAGTIRNYPIVRVGHMASAPQENIKGYYGLAEYYIADLQSYYGHSGGPVWVSFAPDHGTPVEVMLLGVLVSGYPADIPGQGSAPTGKAISLGVSLVVPIHKLLELLMTDEVKKDREAFDVMQDKSQDGAIPLGVPSDDPPFTKADFEQALRKVGKRLPDAGSAQTSDD